LHSRKIGAKTALYWVAWAWVAEKDGDFAFADKIFKKALSKGAEPINILEERHRQFQRRMSRHWLNASSGGDEQEGSNDASSNGAFRRTKLSAITAPASSSNYRLPAVDEESAVANTMSFSQKRSKNGTKAASTGIFCVYVDENDADEEPFDKLHVSPSHQKRQSKLVTESERKKENTVGAEQWSNRGGLAASSSAHTDDDSYREAASVRGPRIVTSSAPKFEVFVEEGIDANTYRDNDSRKSPPKKTETSQRSIRERLDSNNMVSNHLLD
jgi:hypothetical protein